MSFKCLHCNTYKNFPSITCQRCKNARYCNKTCAHEHWYTEHQYTCVGKERETTQQKTFPKSRQQRKKRVTLDTLFEQISRGPPEPTPEQKEAIVSEMMKEPDVQKRIFIYDTIMQSRKNAYEFDMAMGFVADYIRDNGDGSSKKIEMIQKGFIKIVENAQQHMMNGSVDLSEMAFWQDQITELFMDSIGRKTYTPGDGPDLMQEGYHDYVLSLAMTLAMNSPAVPTVKDDFLTDAYGFKVNPIFEGEERNIRARPVWWNTRYDYFRWRLGLIEEEPEFTLRIPKDKDGVFKHVMEDVFRPLPSDYRTRLQIIFELFDMVMERLGELPDTQQYIGIPPGQKKELNDKQKKFGSDILKLLTVENSLRCITTFALSLIALYGVSTGIQYAFTTQHRNVSAAEEAIGTVNSQIPETKDGIDLIHKIFHSMKEGERIADKLFAASTNAKGLDSINFAGPVRTLTDFEPFWTNNTICLPSEKLAYHNARESIAIGELWFRYHLDHLMDKIEPWCKLDESQPRVEVSKDCNYAKYFKYHYEKIDAAGFDDQRKAMAMLEYAEEAQSMYSTFDAKTGKRIEDSNKEVLKSVLRAFEILQLNLLDKGMEMLHKMNMFTGNVTVLSKASAVVVEDQKLNIKTVNAGEEMVKETKSMLNKENQEKYNAIVLAGLQLVGTYGQIRPGYVYDADLKKLNAIIKGVGNVAGRTPTFYEFVNLTGSLITRSSFFLTFNPWVFQYFIYMVAFFESWSDVKVYQLEEQFRKHEYYKTKLFWRISRDSFWTIRQGLMYGQILGIAGMSIDYISRFGLYALFNRENLTWTPTLTKLLTGGIGPDKIFDGVTNFFTGGSSLLLNATSIWYGKNHIFTKIFKTDAVAVKRCKDKVEFWDQYEKKVKGTLFNYTPETRLVREIASFILIVFILVKFVKTMVIGTKYPQIRKIKRY